MEKWALVTATGDGQINTSYHPSEYEAEQARSIALTGMTIEENAAAEASYQDWQHRMLAEARAKAKVRPPTDDEARQIRETGALYGNGWSCGYSAGFTEATENGQVREVVYRDAGMSPAYSSAKGEWVEQVRGGWRVHTRHSIKSARIFRVAAEPTP